MCFSIGNTSIIRFFHIIFLIGDYYYFWFFYCFLLGLFFSQDNFKHARILTFYFILLTFSYLCKSLSGYSFLNFIKFDLLWCNVVHNLSWHLIGSMLVFTPITSIPHFFLSLNYPVRGFLLLLLQKVDDGD